ncbi:putative membrane protein, partial [Clostridioides difficile CD196]
MSIFPSLRHNTVFNCSLSLFSSNIVFIFNTIVFIFDVS